MTGATGGIGGAVARALAAAGATVHALGRRVPAAAAAAWSGTGSTSRTTPRSPPAAELAGGLDVLVHAAGTHGTGPVATLPVAELDRQWRIKSAPPTC